MNIKQGAGDFDSGLPGARMLGAVIGVLILIVCAVVYIPFNPSYPVNNLDSGWCFEVNTAVAKGLAFGRAIIFTIGPYGSVYFRQYNPATSMIMFGGSALMATAVGFMLICLGEGFFRLLALALALLLLLVPYDTQLFAVPFLSLMLIYRVAAVASGAAPWLVKFTFVLTILALAVLTLVKATFVVCAGIVVFCACLLLLRRRKFALVIGSLAFFLGALVAFWILAGQPIGSLPRFFLAQVPIVSGYTDAMSVLGPLWQIVVCTVTCLLLWLFGNFRFRADGDAGWMLAIGSAIILFLSMKEGLVRSPHESIAAGMLGVGGLAYVLLRKTWLAAVACVIGLIGFMTVTNVTGLAPVTSMIIAQFRQNASSISAWIKDSGTYQANYAASLSAIRAAQPLPVISGSVDIYSFGQSSLLAAGLDWDPRPVLQSYSAYTPGLAAADAGHLAGPSAPANVLFRVEPIDNRLASLEDGASWPALLANYAVTGLYGNDLALLHRRPTAEPVPISLLLSGHFRTGQLVSLPTNSPFIWAALDIQPTLLGKLLGIIFKPPQLTIQYMFADGRQPVFRYIPGMARGGFLLTPLVQSTRDFVALSLPYAKEYALQGDATGFRVTPDYGGGLLWHSKYSLKLSTITFPPQPSVGKILFATLQPMMSAAPQPTTAACSIDVINNRPITKTPVVVDGYLHIIGWAAISTAAGTPAEQIAVSLTAPDGSAVSAVASRFSRVDVARYFKQPALANSGFDLQTRLQGMEGDYTVTITPSTGGRSWACSNHIAIRVLGAAGTGLDPASR